MPNLIACNKCGIPKAYTEYAFRGDTQDFRKTCRSCQKAVRDRQRNSPEYRAKERERARRSRREKPEINRRAHAKWKSRHPDRAKALQARYRLRSGSEYLRRWRERNRIRYNAYMNAYQKAARWRRRGLIDLLPRLEKLISPTLYADIRDDVFQEVVMHCLSHGEPDNLSRLVKLTVSQVIKTRGDSRRWLSLDQPVFGDSRHTTLADIIVG